MPTETSFLGRGWAFPPSFSAGGGGVEMVADEEDIQESLRILLATRPGERVMQEGFGCDLESVLFEELDQGLVNSLTRLVEDAIIYHEPRIDLDRIDVERAGEPGLLRISIHYTVRGTNSRYNMVYPFYLDEATFPG
jgi:phage baseplate assembly protein W